MNFYFCEKCNKRITEAELEGGLASDKKAKGIFCRSCSVGVKTTEFAAITDEQIKHASETKVPVADTRRPSAVAIAAAPRSPSSAERHSSIKVASAPRGKVQSDGPNKLTVAAIAGSVGLVTVMIFFLAGSDKPRERKSEPAPAPNLMAVHEKTEHALPPQTKSADLQKDSNTLPQRPETAPPIAPERVDPAPPPVAAKPEPRPAQTEPVQPQPPAQAPAETSKASVAAPAPAIPPPEKPALPVLVDMKDPRIVYAEFQDNLLTALRNGDAQLAAQRLEQAEQNAILKSMQKELQQDRSILKWNSDLDKALLRGIEKLREIDNFELRLTVGAPMQVGKRAAFQLSSVHDGTIDIGAQGVSMAISIDKLQSATRQKLEIMGLSDDGAGLVRRAFVQLLGAGTEAASLAALPAAIERAKKAGAAEDELAAIQRLLKSAETNPRDLAAGLAWDEVSKHMQDKQFSKTILLAELDAFKTGFGDSHFFSKRQDEIKALTHSVALGMNLLIHLKFDDPKALCSNAVESANECKIVGAPAAAPGKLGGAIGLDGAHDYVLLPDDLLRSRTTMTVSVWFNTKAAGGVILGYQNGDVLSTSKMHYVPILYVGTDGVFRGKFWVGDGTDSITGRNPVNDGQWHHVALSAKETIQNLYLDGVCIGTIDRALDHLDMNKNQLGVGFTNGWSKGEKDWLFFNGLLDEFRFYDRALSEQEIQWLSGTQPKSP
jgi:hypothetical protein